MMTLEQRLSRLVELAIKSEMRSIFHDDGLIYTLKYRLRDLDIDYADIFEPYLIEDTDEERKKMYSMCGKVAERVFGEITQKMKAALEMVESSFIHEKVN